MIEHDIRIPVARWLLARDLIPICEVQSLNNCDFIGVRINGNPMQLEYMVAVELKLKHVAGVLRQCKNHLSLTNEAWAAMLPQSKKTIQRFKDAGVGLIFVENDKATEVIPSPVRDVDLLRWRKVAINRRKEYAARLNSPRFYR